MFPDRGTYFLVVLFVLTASPPALAAEPFLVAVGDVTASSAVLWVRAPTVAQLVVEYGPQGEAPTRRDIVRVATTADRTGKLVLSGLRSATRYSYRLQHAGGARAGEFVTAPAPDATTRVSLLWSGDLGGGNFCRRADEGYRIFRAMARHAVDFFLFVGDTIYADHRCQGPGLVPGADFVARTLSQFRQKHRYNREDSAHEAFLRSTSVYAVWDDHEVRNDFAGPTEALMPVGRRAFLEYWPISPPPGDPARLYRRFRWGRLLELFLLDTRQYRNDNSYADGPGKTMLGAVQRRWLLDGVADSSATWKVVVSSVPLSVRTGGAHRDSWSNASPFGLPEEGTGFATERDAIIRAWGQRDVRNVIFLVADVHHPEVIRHHPTPEFSLHEFIAGPLSATQGRPRPLDAGLNPRSLFAGGGVNSYGEIVIEPSNLTVRLLDDDGRTLFTHTIGPE